MILCDKVCQVHILSFLCFKSRCHGVGEGHHTALGVSQPGVKVNQTHLPGYVYGVNSQLPWPAIVQELQENVEDVRMRLFHLISPADFVNWPCHSPNCLTMCLIKEYQGVWPPSNSLKGFQLWNEKSLKKHLKIWQHLKMVRLEHRCFAVLCCLRHLFARNDSKFVPSCGALPINASAQLRKTAKPVPCFCGQYWNLITSTTIFWCLGHIWSQH